MKFLRRSFNEWRNQIEGAGAERGGEKEMKADVEKRLKKLEEKRVFRISTLADFAIWCAMRQKGLPMPEVIEWDPIFKRRFDETFGHH